MTNQENFRLTEHYILTDEDKILIARNSSNPLSKDDWYKSGLSEFKERVKNFLAPRQQKLCAYCRTYMPEASYYYEIEHIVPKNPHPVWMFEPQNFCLACRRCNAKKLDNETLTNPNTVVYPDDSTGFIINPYHDIYSDHIELVEGLFYSGKTSKGIKTIELCNLSRYSLVLHRIEMQFAHDKQDTYVTLLTWLPHYQAYVDDMDSLLAKIQEDINHFIFD